MTESKAFEQAFIGTTALLGAHGAAGRLADPSDGAAAVELALHEGTKEERAARLGALLLPLARALSARRLG